MIGRFKFVVRRNILNEMNVEYARDFLFCLHIHTLFFILLCAVVVELCESSLPLTFCWIWPLEMISRRFACGRRVRS